MGTDLTQEYKNRFREAMNRYILQAPNSWHQWQAVEQTNVPPPRDQMPGGLIEHKSGE